MSLAESTTIEEVRVKVLALVRRYEASLTLDTSTYPDTDLVDWLVSYASGLVEGDPNAMLNAIENGIAAGVRDLHTAVSSARRRSASLNAIATILQRHSLEIAEQISIDVGLGRNSESFAAFVDSRSFVKSLPDDPPPRFRGFIYLSRFVVTERDACASEGTRFHAEHGDNEIESDSLPEIEREIYQWAKASGAIA